MVRRGDLQLHLCRIFAGLNVNDAGNEEKPEVIGLMKETKSEYDLSIVISVYNEEQTLDKFYNAFRRISKGFTWTYELIFVNDGSTDASADILTNIALQDKCVKVIGFSRNFGHEAAMIAGIDYAKGDRIICMDADLQHPLECVFPIMKKFDEGYEVINMVRLSNKSAGLVKNITSGLFYKLVNKISDQTHLEENASDFFAISSHVADVLRSNYREKVRFLRGYVQNVGFRKTKLEYTAGIRAGGESHYSIRALMKLCVNTIVSFSDFPLKLGLLAGFLSAVATVVMFICTLCTNGTDAAGTNTIITVMCLFFTVLFVIIGIIGEYLSVIFAEIKQRPIYIVRETMNMGSECRENEEKITK